MFRRIQLFASLLLMAGVLVVSQGTTMASAVTGQTNGLGSVRVGATTIDFYSLTNGICGLGPNLGTPGCLNITAPTNGSFPGVGAVATIKDLIAPPYPLSGSVAPAEGVAQVNFNNGVLFDLTYIAPGGQGNCATALNQAERQTIGKTCTFYVGGIAGPFTLMNTAGGATIWMTWFGDAYIGLSTTGKTPYVASFTTQINQNIDTIYNTINGGGFIESSYSVTFTSVPEPATMALTGGALLLLGIMRRRKNRQQV